MTILLSLLQSKWAWIGLVVLALLGLFGGMRYEISSLKGQRAALQTQVTTLKGDLAASKKEVELRDKSIAVLQTSIADERARNLVIEGELETIRNAPKTADGPVAPVLKDTLKRLDGILQK